MATVAYATPTQLQAFVSVETWSRITEPDRQLLRASELMDDNVRCPFDVDDMTQLPTDDDTAEALRDATCAQVEAWAEVDEANDIDGMAGTHISVPGYSGPRAPELAPRAYRLLHIAGLLNTGVSDLPLATRFFATESG